MCIYNNFELWNEEYRDGRGDKIGMALCIINDVRWKFSADHYAYWPYIAVTYIIDSGGERDWKRNSRNTFMQVLPEVEYLTLAVFAD